MQPFARSLLPPLGGLAEQIFDIDLKPSFLKFGAEAFLHLIDTTRPQASYI